MKRTIAIGLILALAACAGRSPHPVDVVQPADVDLSCESISAELAANNGEIAYLDGEQDKKHAQNAIALVAALFTLGLSLLAADFQEAAKKDSEALVDRNEHLTELATAQGCEQIEVTT